MTGEAEAPLTWMFSMLVMLWSLIGVVAVTATAAPGVSSTTQPPFARG